MKRFLSVFAVLSVCLCAFGQAEANDLLGYWSMDAIHPNGWLQDQSGNGVDGAMVGDPQVVDGIIGNAIEFDGNDRFNCGDNPIVDLGQGKDFSWEVWVKTTSTDYQGVFSKTWGYPYWDLRLTPGVFGFLDFGGGHYGAVTSASVSDGEWHHIVVTADRDLSDDGSFILYVDGIEVKRDDISQEYLDTLDTANQFIIGALTKAGDNPFIGVMDELAIYNRVLSAGEATMHYLEGAQPAVAAALAALQGGGVTLPINISDVSGLAVELAGKADAEHSHVIADVTGLESALDDTVDVGTYNAHSHNKGSGGRNTGTADPQIVVVP